MGIDESPTNRRIDRLNPVRLIYLNNLASFFYVLDTSSDRAPEDVMIIIRNARRHIIKRLKRRQQLQRRWQQPVLIRLSLGRPAVAWVTDVASRAAAIPPAAKIFLRPNSCTAVALVAVSTTIEDCPIRPLVFPPSRWPSTLPPRPSRFDSASPSIPRNENAVSSDSAENIAKPSKAKAHRFVQSSPCYLYMNLFGIWIR